MDSSNNDSFGSFGVSGGTGGSGSIISSGGDSGAVMPAGISSGSGGISSGGSVVIGGGASKKGKKWIWAVILGMVFVVALVGGYFLISSLTPKQGGDSNNVVNKGDSKAEFNKYANYVLYGKDSEASINYDSADSVAYFSAISGDALAKYVENANAKYWSFDKAYHDNSGKENLEYLKAYFQDFASISPLKENDIIEKYISGGKTLVEKMIAEKYVLDGTDADVLGYLNAEKELAELRLGILVNVEAAGCLRDGNLVTGCYGLTNEEGEEMARLVVEAQDYSRNIILRGWNTFQDVYNELYDVEDEEGSSV